MIGYSQKLKFPSFSADQIAHAIQVFPATYHADFATTRAAALAWRRGETSNSQLATRLDRALLSWGAGRRMAPKLGGQTNEVLNLESVGTVLEEFERRALRGVTSVEEAWYDDRPELLVSAVQQLNALFKQNDSVTYPTKALLLLTGHYIGLDSNVRAAIAAAGIPGFRETRFPMPVKLEDRSAQRMTLVLGLAGAWLAEHESVISEALSRSPTGQKLAELSAPARVLDICLFVHGSGRA